MADTATLAPVGTERIAQALRNGTAERLQDASPYAACLLPLLKALGWRNYTRELIEALPHFAEHVELVDLRNILVTLGYQSAPIKTRIEAIKPELLPCLFLSRNGGIYILQAREGREVSYFDARAQQDRRGEILGERGTAYVFTDTHPNHGVSAANTTSEAWFSSLLQRFKGMLIHLLSMTFVINLTALLVPLFVMMVYDKVIGARSPDTLPHLLWGVAILVSADLGLRALRARLLGAMAGRLDYLIGVETFRQLVYLAPLYTERSTVAAQLSRLRQFDSVRDFFTGPNAAIALELPFAGLFIAVIAVLAGSIALIPLAMLATYALFGLLWLPELRNKALRAGTARNDRQRVLLQSLAGRNEIKAIGGETVWSERFRETSGEAVMANYRSLVANAIMTSITQGLTTLAGVAVLGMGTLAVMEGEMTIGALIATMALVWRVLSPLQSAFLSLSKLEQMIKAVQQINQLMRLKVERQGAQSGLMLSRLKGRITVDRVSFRYGPDQDPAVLGVSFDIQPGEMVAITGHTGSGKSTLLKLIAGMYRPQAGALLIDGLDIRQLNAMDLRRALAYVPQETRFFHGTVAQNMRLNNGLATDHQLRKAAAEAGILDEILALPQGFDTWLGDNTTGHLPPGLLRALSMARAFVSPARILLLDEPGASLDLESDRRLVEQIKRLRGRRTIIMVSHRPSHIRLADQAVMLSQGSVRCAGPVDEVIARLLESAS